MATQRSANRTALLMVDAQVGVLAGCWQAEAKVACMAQAVARARAAQVPVFWVQHHNSELPLGSPAWQWAPGLDPRDGEPRIDKRFNSAFEDTPLEPLLAAAGIGHLVLAGAATNWCIRATAYAALDRGYNLTLVSDAHTTGDLQADGGAAVPAEAIVRELNTTMTWLEYPGRRNSAQPAADIDFSGPAGPA